MSKLSHEYKPFQWTRPHLFHFFQELDPVRFQFLLPEWLDGDHAAPVAGHRDVSTLYNIVVHGQGVGVRRPAVVLRLLVRATPKARPSVT